VLVWGEALQNRQVPEHDRETLRRSGFASVPSLNSVGGVRVMRPVSLLSTPVACRPCE